jgi:hypothetical protein
MTKKGLFFGIIGVFSVWFYWSYGISYDTNYVGISDVSFAYVLFISLLMTFLSVLMSANGFGFGVFHHWIKPK